MHMHFMQWCPVDRRGWGAILYHKNLQCSPVNSAIFYSLNLQPRVVANCLYFEITSPPNFDIISTSEEKNTKNCQKFIK